MFLQGKRLISLVRIRKSYYYVCECILYKKKSVNVCVHSVLIHSKSKIGNYINKNITFHTENIRLISAYLRTKDWPTNFVILQKFNLCFGYYKNLI
jgi:hypothetical protein